jgi:hypothetical protein
VILIAKENTKNVQQIFPAYFSAVQKACNDTLPQKYGLNVELAHNADMSELLGYFWEAAKQRELPCHCCPITNRALVLPNLNHCRWCYIMGHKERDENFLCYHTDMLTEENVK